MKYGCAASLFTCNAARRVKMVEGPLSQVSISLLGGVLVGARALLDIELVVCISPPIPVGRRVYFRCTDDFLPAIAAHRGRGGGSAVSTSEY
jgi:hypothetical protein